MQDQKMQDHRSIQAWIRDLWPLVAIIVVCNLSGGSECFWKGSTNNTKVNQNNNPVLWAPEGQEVPADAEPYLLETYRIEAAMSPEESAIPSLRNVSGVSLARAGVEEVSPQRLREFTHHVLEVNDELLGLPEHAGALVFLKVVDRGEQRLVIHAHMTRDGQGNPSAVPGSLLIFAYDAGGRLLEIASTVRWPK